MNKLLLPVILVGGLFLFPSKKHKSKSIIPIKYGCDYVKLLSNDDVIRIYLTKIKDEYFRLKPSTELEEVNFVDFTRFMIRKLDSPICEDKFDKQELSKDQGFLIYILLSYFTIYYSIYEKFSTGADPQSAEQLLIIFKNKKKEVQQYLGIDFEEDENYKIIYKTIIASLEKNRDYYIL